MKRPNILWAAPLALATAGLVIFLPTMNAAKAAAAPDSESVLKLLSDAKTTAFQLKEDAEAMESFTRVNLTWESHAKAITVIKDHVNELGRIVGKLREARAEASPWQKTAIDRIVPFLDELGGYTSAVIEHINANRQHLDTAEYKDYLEANVDYSADMAAIISDFVNFGKTKARFERLSDKLELPASR
jgi:hypothetical protein